MTKKNRRQFLRNTALAAFSVSSLPTLVKGNTNKISTSKELVNCPPTTLDFYGQGPFYTSNPPILTDDQLAAAEEEGTRMIISGRVYNLDCGQFLPDTLIDLWHANHDGQYDNQGYNLRGKIHSNSQGFYVFETIKPGKYLNGSTFRPSHIHVKVKPPDFPTLTTQIYFEGDDSIPGDAAASMESGQFDASDRIISLSMNAAGKLEGTWDIIVDGIGPNSVQDLHINKGMIYEASPNPFSDKVLIKYGVFQAAKVALLVYDIQGKLVATLDEQALTPEKYEAVWQPDSRLANGYYFVALKVNDLQVHYLKLVRQQ